jgi:hypothetical protein
MFTPLQLEFIPARQLRTFASVYNPQGRVAYFLAQAICRCASRYAQVAVFDESVRYSTV